MRTFHHSFTGPRSPFAAACGAAALVVGIAGLTVPASAAPMATGDFITTTSPITPLSATVAGGGNTIASSATDFPGSEAAPNIRDDNTSTKYLNFNDPDGTAGAARPGVNTGFAITLSGGPAVAKAFQFATASSFSGRDPVSVTVEGSTADAATSQAAGFSGWTLLYSGTSGLATNPGVQTYGDVVGFSNNTAYQSYRVLVTGVRGTADNSTEYSEFQLLPVPEPGSVGLVAAAGMGLLARRRRHG